MHPITAIGILILMWLLAEVVKLKTPVAFILLIPYILVLVRIVSDLEKDESKEKEEQKELLYTHCRSKHINFHGTCVACTKQELNGLEYCKGCTYFSGDKSLPDISTQNCDTNEWFLEQEMKLQAKENKRKIEEEIKERNSSKEQR